MKISVCMCRFYNRISEATIITVAASAIEAGFECEIVPDLCYISAKEPDKLSRIASCDVVLACQPRAVHALLGNPVSVNCIDIRKMTIDEILASLSLPIAKQPLDLYVEELLSDWVPWFPVIDANRCVHCKKCVDFCMFGVYSIDADKVCVTKPDACKTDCPACARICPQNAIIFPKSEEELVNGSLIDPVKPSAEAKKSFAERLRHRKRVPLFKEDEQ
jgi:MinD superfamily P-loop ATPase containing an inserted ferredoxin domain